MRHDDWPQLVLLFHFALKNAPSPQRKNVAPITAFTSRPASNPVITFLRSFDCQPITLTEVQLELTLSVSELVTMMKKLYPLIHQHTQQEGARIQLSRGKGELANFSECDYVLDGREDFFEAEKLCLR